MSEAHTDPRREGEGRGAKGSQGREVWDKGKRKGRKEKNGGEERKESEKYNEWVSISPARTDSDSSGYIYKRFRARNDSDSSVMLCQPPRSLRSLARLLSSPRLRKGEGRGRGRGREREREREEKGSHVKEG